MVFFHYGKKAYYVGGHPLWMVIRAVSQMRQKPYIIGGLLFYWGYLLSFIKRVPRAVTPELMAFHRGEQLARMKQILTPNRCNLSEKPKC
ncbi:MAG TPA: glycosyltransferase family 2 protein, partial [Candidatus Saccharibacteria bacterium]|nr:glycosyltransferase family 2 protein [Candidatus Saccharibacteria bacterium]